MLNHLFNLLIAFVCFLMLASTLIKFTDLPPWTGTMMLIVVGAFFYLLNLFLIRSYIKKRAPEFANDENWELTAGLGIVPRWVSFLGLLPIPALIASIVWLGVWYWPR